MGIRTDKSFIRQLIFITILIMLVALFTARGVLSAGMILFLALTCFHVNFLSQLKRFISNPLFVAISLIFFIPFITGLWSEDKDEWLRWVRIKLPVVLLPVAFAGTWQLTTKQWKIIAYVFLGMIFLGCCWSLWQYLGNIHTINKGYLKAKIFDTPLENDHVRYSLLVCIAVICAFVLMFKKPGTVQKIILTIAALFFIVYLHILSARTGLLNLYIFLGMLVFYLLWSVKKTKLTILFTILVLLMPVAAWFFLPTFENRVRYVLYDFSFIQKETYLPGSNDGNRILSIKAGWSLLQQNPWGVGSGDVIHETYDWYDDNVPEMLESDKLYPSSELMLYGASAGWPGFILFIIALTIPLFVRISTHRFFFIALNVVIAFSFLFDIGLETQFGVFIYAFSILWWWKWLNNNE